MPITNGISSAAELVRAPFGLETVAEVEYHDEDDLKWVQGYNQENALCQYAGSSWEPCNPAEVAPLYAANDGDRYIKTVPFFVQAEDMCKDVLWQRRPEARTNLMSLLDVLSFKGMEHELWYGTHTQAATIPDAPNQYLEMAGAVSVGTVMDPVLGLAAVSERLAVLLPGSQGVIHMTHGTAVVLSSHGLLEADGKVMRVKGTGTPVVIGSGYADTNDGTSTIYGTGPIVAHMGPSKIVTAGLTQGANISTNEFTLIAERPVGVEWDGCIHVKAGISY